MKKQARPRKCGPGRKKDLAVYFLGMTLWKDQQAALGPTMSLLPPPGTPVTVPLVDPEAGLVGMCPVFISPEKAREYCGDDVRLVQVTLHDPAGEKSNVEPDRG